MLMPIPDALSAVLLCWGVTFATIVGVAVLPWGRRQLLRTHVAVLATVELVRRRLVIGAAAGPVVVAAELPELAWDVAGDWTTVTG